MNEKIKVGLVGYGGSARLFHLPFIKAVPELEIHAILQRSPPGSATPHCTIDYPHVKHYQELGGFLGDEQIQLVVICSATSTHVSIATAALKAGKHVEKPFAPTSEEADQVIKVAKESARILTVYQNRRYDNDYLTLKSLVNQSAFGDILEVQLHHDLTGNPWIQKMDQKRVTGNGMAYVAGSHAVDHALDLFGTPRTVTAWFRSFRGTPSDNEDSYHITLTYNSPLIVHVKTNAMSIMPRVLTHFVRGSSGSWFKFGSDPQVKQAIDGMEPGSVGYGEDPEPSWGQLATKERFSEVQQKEGDLWVGNVRTIPGNWPGYYSDLVKAIKGLAPIKVDPQTSRVGIRIIELAWQSVQEARTVEYSEFK